VFGLRASRVTLRRSDATLAAGSVLSKSRSCFLHVQKSGGSSVISQLKSTLGAAHVFHANESRYQQAPLDVLVAQYPVVAGHFSFAQIPDDLFANTFFFTFLRDPIDRALSHYYYYRTQPETCAGDGRIAMARELDLESFVDTLADRPSPWSNWQTFLFSGATDAEQPAADLLASALRNLERLDFVGVHDDFDAGLHRLFQMRGWSTDAVAPRVNVTESRLRHDQIPAAVRYRLHELNRCDVELFACARQLWEDTKSLRMGRAQKPSDPEERHQGVPGEPEERRVPGDRTAAVDRRARSEQGTKEIVFTGMSLRTEPARLQGVIEENDRVFLELRGVSSITTDDLTVGIRITDALGVEVYGVNTHLLGIPVRAREGETFCTTFAFDMILAPGVYQITVAVHASDDHLHRCYHWIDNALTFECRRVVATAFSGLVDLKAIASIE
jgi:hypothetical protein